MTPLDLLWWTGAVCLSVIFVAITVGIVVVIVKSVRGDEG